MMYGYKEHKFMTSEDLRKICITNKFYEQGNNEEYAEFLNSVKNAEMNSDKVVELAQNIVDHSDESVKEIKRLCGFQTFGETFIYIMELIAEKIRISYVEC